MGRRDGMNVKLGYLLPTRERAMRGIHETDEILALADHAEAVGLDSAWIGDSLLAKPRHDPLSLIAAIAGRTERVVLGTAVLLPMLRNPVVLAQQLATIDQIAKGRLVLGVGIGQDMPAAHREFEAAGVPFEKRVGRMLEGLRLYRALWTSDAPVNWDGRWTLRDAELAPKPHTPGGPIFWGGGGVPNALRRAGKNFDGWFPAGSGDAAAWAKGWRQVTSAAEEAGRDPTSLTGAAYVTIAINEDVAKAKAELDDYLGSYYMMDPAKVRRVQYTCAGDRAAVTAWLGAFAEAGCSHFCVRVTGSRDREQMDMLVKIREQLTA